MFSSFPTIHPEGCVCSDCDLFGPLDETSSSAGYRVNESRIAVPSAPEPLPTLELTFNEKVELLKNKIDKEVLGGLCYFCSRTEVLGKLRSHGGLICGDCGLKFLFKE